MLRGNVRVVFLRPGDPVEVVDPSGLKQKISINTEFPAWVRRLDRGGGERIQSETVIGEWSVRWTVPKNSVPGISQAWSLRDEDGNTHQITQIAKTPTRRGYYVYSAFRAVAA